MANYYSRPSHDGRELKRGRRPPRRSMWSRPSHDGRELKLALLDRRRSGPVARLTTGVN